MKTLYGVYEVTWFTHKIVRTRSLSIVTQRSRGALLNLRGFGTWPTTWKIRSDAWHRKMGWVGWGGVGWGGVGWGGVGWGGVGWGGVGWGGVGWGGRAVIDLFAVSPSMIPLDMTKTSEEDGGGSVADYSPYRQHFSTTRRFQSWYLDGRCCWQMFVSYLRPSKFPILNSFRFTQKKSYTSKT